MERPKPDSTQIYNLSRPLTTFIGRSREIGQVKALLLDPACRLLTLAGPGGVGKTRLAIQAAVAGSFTHGAGFVALQSVKSADFLVSAIADALNVPLAGQSDPLVQLLHHLRDKELLLLLDNFEQLLGLGGRRLLLRLLQAAPQVKLLVTSREALNLQGEWLYPLAGLAVPTGQRPEDWQTYDAVRLFGERAGRVRPDFSLAAEAASVLRICQLVEGMPLAIELAAAWVKMMRCADIAAEIQHNLEFLATPFGRR